MRHSLSGRSAIVFMVALMGAAGAGGVAAAEICVENHSDAAYFFTAETHDGVRGSASLPVGARLCLDEPLATPGGVVAAFDGADRLEGCSRLVGPGGSDALLAYVDFDRCRWVSNSD